MCAADTTLEPTENLKALGKMAADGGMGCSNVGISGGMNSPRSIGI
jgi:hypothetical protein